MEQHSLPDSKGQEREEICSVTVRTPCDYGFVLALEAFKKRKAAPKERIDNSRLRAGAPMYYYCHGCGDLADQLPETHTEQPRRFCEACKPLRKAGLITAEGDIVK